MAREGLDPGPRPDERVGERQLDAPLPAGAFTVHEPRPQRGGLRLLHAGAEVLARVHHRRRRDLVRKPHALELLAGLDRARPREQRSRVGGVAEALEPRGREGGRLADHAVRRLRAQGELEADPLEVACRGLRQLEGARGRGPRVVVRVPAQEADVVHPGVALCVIRRRLEADQRGLALAREDDGVVALHRPEVGQVEHVVGGAHDERVERLLRPSARAPGRA